METKAPAKPLLAPQRLHFTCSTCAGCCRQWNVFVTEADVARFASVDWAASRPRFTGRELTVRLPDGKQRLTRIEDACIFLDDDDLCAIHKELGMEAKPLPCQQFPYRPIETPDGLVASFDFACPTVVANEGAPIEEHEAEFRRLAALIAAAPSDSATKASPGAGGQGVEACPGVPLAWADYLALEDGLLGMLRDTARPLTERMLLLDRMATQASQHAAPGAMAEWVASLRASGWQPLTQPADPMPTATKQRALLAPAVTGIEGSWNVQAGGRGSATARIAFALAFVGAQKTVPLPSAGDAPLSLANMRTVRFPQDQPPLANTFARYLEAYVVRKGLIEGTSLTQGARYLAVTFGVARWYAVARAVLTGRAVATDADLRYAIMLVERRLSHGEGFRTGPVSTILSFMFDHVAPARSLYPSPYPA